MRILKPLVLGLLCTACTLERQLSRSFLVPALDEVATPDDLGIAYEDVVIQITDDIALHGWFLPAEDAQGRTVVLLHGSAANISYYHPYYTFLHDAGFNVFLIDYRGYGKSTGEVSINGLFFDLDDIVKYLRGRDDVRRDRIAWYGISLGSMLATRIASTFHNDAAAVVVENVISPRGEIQASLMEQGGDSLGTATQVFFLEIFVLVDNMEPRDHVAELECPILLLEGQREWDTGLQAHVATWNKAPKALRSAWILPDTGHAPHSLLTHDGAYQDAVVDFLSQAFSGRLERVDAEWEMVQDIETGGLAIDVELQRVNARDAQPWPIQIALIDGEGRVQIVDRWLMGERDRLRVPADGMVRAVSAFRRMRVEGRPEEGSWQAPSTHLTRAGRILESLTLALNALRAEPESAEHGLVLARQIERAEQKEPFHPLLEAQLAEAYMLIGRALLATAPASGEKWLRRCVASEPESPHLHYWPGRPYTAGFPHGSAIAEARTLLSR